MSSKITTYEVAQRWEYGGSTENDPAEFEQWLAERDAEKWDEGYQACVDRLRPGVLMTPNPYRGTGDDE